MITCLIDMLAGAAYGPIFLLLLLWTFVVGRGVLCSRTLGVKGDIWDIDPSPYDVKCTAESFKSNVPCNSFVSLSKCLVFFFLRIVFKLLFKALTSLSVAI